MKKAPLLTQSAVYPKVIVIGGSLGGLCSALALRFINWDVMFLRNLLWK
ncbi:MAG: hypothetical protein ABJB76_03720 [Candidatus Nitrosocosmicus sp.]